MQIIYRKAEKIYQFSTFLEEISQKCRLKYKLNELEVSQKISMTFSVFNDNGDIAGTSFVNEGCCQSAQLSGNSVSLAGPEQPRSSPEAERRTH